MKKISILFAASLLVSMGIKAQNTFPATGRVGIYTTNPNVSLQVNGGARFGFGPNGVNIDSATGNLSFRGNGRYNVANNAYAFGAVGSQAGLYFNATDFRLDFRDTAGFPIFNLGVRPGGNVGIGTIAPTQKLSITANTEGNDGLTIQNTNVNGNGQVRFLNAAGAEKYAITYNPAFNKVFHYIDGSNLLNLDGNNKRIGIDTEFPTALLDVAGSFKARLIDVIGAGLDEGGVVNLGNSDNSRQLIIFGGRQNDPDPLFLASANTAFRFSTFRNGYTEMMRIDSTGRLGIGTSAPTAKLDVVGNIKIADGTQGVGKILTSDANGLASWQTPATGASGWNLSGNTGTNNSNFIGTTDNQSLRFRTNNTQRFIIDSLGNVGIGVSGAPGGLLDVNGRSRATSFAVTSGFGDLVNNAPWYGLGYSNLTLPNQTSPATQLAGFWGINFVDRGGNMVFSNGTLGLGTNAPLAKFHVQNDINAEGGAMISNLNAESLAFSILRLRNNSSDGVLFKNSSTRTADGGPNTLTLRNDNADLRLQGGGGGMGILVQNGTGNVGIGTTSPAAKLEVAGGDARINGLTVGKGSGNISNNTANGVQALFSNTTGGGNTANGFQALVSNTTGTANTANGVQALVSNTTGGANTANGFLALRSNTTGTLNTANGYLALQLNTTGSFNTAVGDSALRNNTIGLINTAVGASALRSNTTGGANTAVGGSALLFNTIGTANTAVGYGAFGTINNLNNATAIGYLTTVDASNKVRIGNTSVTSIGGQVNWTVFSDARIKKNIKANVPGLAFINLLKPVTYNYDVDKENQLLGIKESEESKAIAGKKDIEQINFTGLLAQDVDAAAKKIGYDFSGVDNTGKIMGLRYSEFVVPLVKAVQELSKQNDDLNTIIAAQQQQINEILQKLGNNPAAQAANGSNQSILLNNIEAASLQQNAPNPFSNSTVIKYNVPASVNNAQIIITDNRGTAIKTITLTQKGNAQVTLSAGTLAAGTYFYSLVVDGKKADTKQMQIVR